jgi:hypothetical protein
MNHCIYSSQSWFESFAIAYVAAGEFETWVGPHPQQGMTTMQQGVQHANLVPFGQEYPNQCRADITRAACDEYFHSCPYY